MSSMCASENSNLSAGDKEISTLIAQQEHMVRADYAPASHKDDCARIESVRPGSPADKGGLEAGMILTHIEGHPLRDMIDWSWYGDDYTLYLEGLYFDAELSRWEEFECELGRDVGEDWGVEFSSAVFDGIRTCKNACVFCFMSMLPKDMRSSLYLRDDDYRLSFLQGNFVTFTNMNDNDVARVLEQHLSPLNMSLHVIDPHKRREMIGKNHARGVEVLEELLSNGIEIHGQIVLCPGLNDGEALRETLSYIEGHAGITSVGIVPLGFTKHQKRFSRSFQDPQSAAEVLKIVEPFQKRSRNKDGITRYHLADEFYLWTSELPPSAEYYDGYPQYYDGIGMYRYFIDEFVDLLSDRDSALHKLDTLLGTRQLVCFTGTGFAPAFSRLLAQAHGQGVLKQMQVEAVKNDYFGGNVDVAGLLCAEDILSHLDTFLAKRPQASDLIVTLPEVMFNFDGLTLDGMHKEDLRVRMGDKGVILQLVPTEPRALFSHLTLVLDYEQNTQLQGGN